MDFTSLTVAKSHIFKVLSSEAETNSLESDDQATSEMPYRNVINQNFRYSY